MFFFNGPNRDGTVGLCLIYFYGSWLNCHEMGPGRMIPIEFDIPLPLDYLLSITVSILPLSPCSRWGRVWAMLISSQFPSLFPHLYFLCLSLFYLSCKEEMQKWEKLKNKTKRTSGGKWHNLLKVVASQLPLTAARLDDLSEDLKQLWRILLLSRFYLNK